MQRPASAEQLLETEGVLVVCADRPAEVLVAVAALPAVGEWELEPLPPQGIEDVYYDDADRSLRRRRVALRIRRVDGDPVVTLKAPRGREGGVSTRLEIEEPWSPESLRRIVAPLDELTRLTLPVPAAAAAPEAALRELGLRAVQRRRTDRERRAVLASGGPTIASAATTHEGNHLVAEHPCALMTVQGAVVANEHRGLKRDLLDLQFPSFWRTSGSSMARSAQTSAGAISSTAARSAA